VLAGAAVLAACNRGAEPGGGAAAHRGAAPTADAAQEQAPAAWLAEVQRGSPEDVVRLLLQWDTAGLRLEGLYADALMQLYCYLPEQQCRSDEPAWDFVLVVDGYLLDPVLEATDSAQYVVTFDEVGIVWPDGLEEPAGAALDTLSLKRMDGRWRVVGVTSQMPPHLSRHAVLRTYRGVQPDSAVIARWLEERE
jgi:hypothetical protein